MAPFSSEIRELLQNLEVELRQLGLWDDQAIIPPDANLSEYAPFGGRRLSFERWLQLILIPSVSRCLAGEEELPTHSQLGVAAVRNFDGQARCDRIVDLLSELDDVVTRAARQSPA